MYSLYPISLGSLSYKPITLPSCQINLCHIKQFICKLKAFSLQFLFAPCFLFVYKLYAWVNGVHRVKSLSTDYPLPFSANNHFNIRIRLSPFLLFHVLLGLYSMQTYTLSFEIHLLQLPCLTHFSTAHTYWPSLISCILPVTMHRICHICI